MKKRLISFICIGIASVAAVASIGTVSYALFSASIRVEQGVGSAGIAKKSIYLCPNIWEVDNPLYEMHAYKGANYTDIYPSKTVSITVSGINMDCKVFEFDAVKYDTFVFYRKESADTTIWNQTDDISYNSSKNVYRIKDWHDSPHSNSGYDSYNYLGSN